MIDEIINTTKEFYENVECVVGDMVEKVSFPVKIGVP